MFCSKLQTQLARHLKTVPRNKPDVKKFAVLPKNNPEQRKIIDTLRKNGNFKFNTKSKLNNRKLIVCQRPNKKMLRILLFMPNARAFLPKKQFVIILKIALEKNLQKIDVL